MANHWLDLNHDHFGLDILPDEFLQDAGENTHPAPAKPAILEGLVRPIVGRSITPAQAIAIDKYNATQHPPVINPGNPVRQGKEWLQPRHLLIRQPVKIGCVANLCRALKGLAFGHDYAASTANC